MNKKCLSFWLGLLLASCTAGLREPTEAELSSFGRFVYELDTLQLEQNWKAVLQADTSRWRSDITVRRHYAGVEHFVDKAVWFSRMGVSADADSLLSHLRRELPLNGLDSCAFFVPQIARDLEVVRLLMFDSLGVNINEVLPRLDYHLSRAFVRYTTGQRYGFLRPAPLFNRLDKKVSSEDYARLFDYEIAAPDYETSLQQLTSEDRMDYLLSSCPAGVAYPSLRARMAATTDKAERHTLAVNMERCRWQMAQPAGQERHILVNLPSQQLWAVEPDSVLSMRICCGAVPTKTPLLHSAMTYLQVNPDWIIPQNIVKHEVLRHAGDSAYFARNHYYIVQRSSGDTLCPASVTAAQMESGRLRIGQHGGAGNSLGRIVFRFPNDFAVYLHDTNNRGAFNRERRTLSHGCIRVQKPFELARFLLPEADEWTLERIRLSMDLAPETDRGREYLRDHQADARPLRLIAHQNISPRVPVYIVYYTAFPNPASGEVEFHPDLYSYDQVISRELKGIIE